MNVIDIFKFTEIHIAVFTAKMLFTKEKLGSLKLGIFVLAMDHNCLAVPRAVNVHLKHNTVFWEYR